MIDFTTSSLLLGVFLFPGYYVCLSILSQPRKPSRTSSSISTSPEVSTHVSACEPSFPQPQCTNHALRPGVRGSDGHHRVGCGRDADWTVSLLGSVSVLFADELGTSVDCGLFQRSCSNAAEVWQTAWVYRSPLQLVYKATRLLMP